MYYKGAVTSSSLWICLIVVAFTGCHRHSADDWPSCDLKIGRTKAKCKVACNPTDYSAGFKAAGIAGGDGGDAVPLGVCFVFPSKRIMVFSMKGVSVPVDLVLVSPDGTALFTTQMAAQSDELYSFSEPARIALEFPEGFIRQNDIRPGARILSLDQMERLYGKCGFANR